MLSNINTILKILIQDSRVHDFFFFGFVAIARLVFFSESELSCAWDHCQRTMKSYILTPSILLLLLLLVVVFAVVVVVVVVVLVFVCVMKLI